MEKYVDLKTFRDTIGYINSISDSKFLPILGGVLGGSLNMDTKDGENSIVFGPVTSVGYKHRLYHDGSSFSIQAENNTGTAWQSIVSFGSGVTSANIIITDTTEINANVVKMQGDDNYIIGSTLISNCDSTTITGSDLVKLESDNTQIIGEIVTIASKNSGDVNINCGGNSSGNVVIEGGYSSGNIYIGPQDKTYNASTPNVNITGLLTEIISGQVDITGSGSGINLKNITTITGQCYATAFYETSDENLKDFSGDVDVDFAKLKDIRKSYFTWKDNNNKTQIGTSAQDVQKVYPELVSEDNKGNLTVDYAKLSIIALSAIDKLDERLSKIEKALNIIE